MSRPPSIFSAVSEEVQRLFELDEETLDVATVVRFDPGPAFTLVGAAKDIEGLPLGTRWGPNDLYVSTRVHRTGRFARVDETDLRLRSADRTQKPCAARVSSRRLRVRSSSRAVCGVQSPSTPEQAAARHRGTTQRFTDLVAASIANTESRAELAASEGRARKLAEEQAALRRVATLVARESLPEELFAVVAEEVGRVMNVPLVALARYEPDGSAIQLVGGWSEGALPVPIGRRYLLDGPSSFASVWQTRKPARTATPRTCPERSLPRGGRRD